MTLIFFSADELVYILALVRVDSILVAKYSLSLLPSNLLHFLLPFNLLPLLWSLDNKKTNLHAL